MLLSLIGAALHRRDRAGGGAWEKSRSRCCKGWRDEEIIKNVALLSKHFSNTANSTGQGGLECGGLLGCPVKY